MANNFSQNQIKLNLSTELNKSDDFNCLEFLEKFSDKIIEQSYNFNYESFKKIIINFNENIPLIIKAKTKAKATTQKINYDKIKDSMRDENSLNKNKEKDNCEMSYLDCYKMDYTEINSAIIQILQFVLNFENIFMNFTNKSLEITFDYILLIIENKLIESTHLILSLLNKMIQTSRNSYIEKEYLTRLKIVLDNLNIKENTKHLVEMLKMTYDKIEKVNYINKNFIELTEFLDEELENSSFSEEIQNKNFSLTNSLNIEFNSLENFKSRVNQNLRSEDILKVYHELKKESQLIEDAMNNRIFGVYFFSRFSNLQIKYLYIFKKILDSLDQLIDLNMKKIFYNLIFRSKSFCQFLLRETYISNNFINLKDKEIYINSYLIISHFFTKNILNTDPKKFELFCKLVDKILINFKAEIKKFMENKRQISSEYRFLEYSFDTSDFNKELSSYMYSSFFNYEFGEILMNVNVFNVSWKNLQILIKELKELFVRVSIVDYVMINNSNMFLSISTIYIKNIHLIISFNSNVVFTQNILYPLIISDSVYFNLFIFIKFWAIQRKLIITFDNSLSKENEENFLFDNSVLMFLIIYYLLNISAIPKVNRNNSSQFFKFFKQKNFREVKNENSYEYQIEEIIYVAEKLDDQQNKFSDKKKKNFELGKLFVNFFYFILQITNKVKQNPDSNLLIDLNSESPNLIKRKQNGNIIFVDYLFKYCNNKSLKLAELPSYCKNLQESFKTNFFNDKEFYVNNKNFDFDIVEVWDLNKINKIEREANRLLHYLLKCEEEDLIKIFLKNNTI